MLYSTPSLSNTYIDEKLKLETLEQYRNGIKSWVPEGFGSKFNDHEINDVIHHMKSYLNETCFQFTYQDLRDATYEALDEQNRSLDYIAISDLALHFYKNKKFTPFEKYEKFDVIMKKIKHRLLKAEMIETIQRNVNEYLQNHDDESVDMKDFFNNTWNTLF